MTFDVELGHLNNQIKLLTHGFLVVVVFFLVIVVVIWVLILITSIFFILVEQAMNKDPMKICVHLRVSRSHRRRHLQRRHLVFSS